MEAWVLDKDMDMVPGQDMGIGQDMGSGSRQDMDFIHTETGELSNVLEARR